ncbi:hypothetical protein PR048_032493 [Dryococelus australis]|uniref:Uncharacterized protein n=1 Tax=Dryococelus australis TaxID=614101 RepID=A0ABQ9G2C1_9NEOP|nr:hypothetical protein PR048_032493 [Dryococelus australis]
MELDTMELPKKLKADVGGYWETKGLKGSEEGPAAVGSNTARWGKRQTPEKTRRPATSSGTIPTCENPGVTWPGIEPGSSWWEASRLTAKPPRPLNGLLHKFYAPGDVTSQHNRRWCSGKQHWHQNSTERIIGRVTVQSSLWYGRLTGTFFFDESVTGEIYMDIRQSMWYQHDGTFYSVAFRDILKAQRGLSEAGWLFCALNCWCEDIPGYTAPRKTEKSTWACGVALTPHRPHTAGYLSARSPKGPVTYTRSRFELRISPPRRLLSSPQVVTIGIENTQLPSWSCRTVFVHGEISFKRSSPSHQHSHIASGEEARIHCAVSPFPLPRRARTNSRSALRRAATVGRPGALQFMTSWDVSSYPDPLPKDINSLFLRATVGSTEGEKQPTKKATREKGKRERDGTRQKGNRCRNESAGETGDPRGNPSTSGIVPGTIPTCENAGVNRPGIEPNPPDVQLEPMDKPVQPGSTKRFVFERPVYIGGCTDEFPSTRIGYRSLIDDSRPELLMSSEAILLASVRLEFSKSHIEQRIGKVLPLCCRRLIAVTATADELHLLVHVATHVVDPMLTDPSLKAVHDQFTNYSVCLQIAPAARIDSRRRFTHVTSLALEVCWCVYTSATARACPHHINMCNWRVLHSRGGVVVRLLASHLGESGSIPVDVDPGFPYKGIVPVDAVGRQVFSGVSSFPPPLHSGTTA